MNDGSIGRGKCSRYDGNAPYVGSYAAGNLRKPRKKGWLIRLSKVTKGYRRIVFQDVDLTIESGEHVGLVGVNGCGKTTLLRTMIGSLEPESGNVLIRDHLVHTEVAQIPELEDDGSLLSTVVMGTPDYLELRTRMTFLLESMTNPSIDPDEMKRSVDAFSSLDEEYRLAGGYEVESRAIAMLEGLGLGGEMLEREFNTLSGGEKTRAIIARSLIAEPDLLLLDEPTNHLDIASMEWLEEFLTTVSCAYIIISHDRSFLDATVDRIVELENGRVSLYPGNYSKYKELKEQRVLKQERDYEKQRRGYNRDVIEQLELLKKPAIGKKAKKRYREAKRNERDLLKWVRCKMYNQPIIEKPFKQKDIRVLFKPEFAGAAEVVKASGLAKSFGAKRIFDRLSFTLRRGQKLGMMGPNGSGKTTLIRIITGDLDPDRGEVALGSYVSPVIYDQELDNLDPDKTVLKEAKESDPHDRGNSIRSLLAALLFRGEDVNKQVKKLSGGERGRLAIAKLVISGSNFLLLDEPTNHLDIKSREVLEEALKTYMGTIVMASHDRRLIANVCDSLIIFGGSGARVFNNNYDSYRRSLHSAETTRIRMV